MKKPLKAVSGTTLALTSLAVFGAAAIVSTPFVIWYRRKRKRTDTFAGTPPSEGRPAPAASPDVPGSPDPAPGGPTASSPDKQEE